MLEQIEKKGNQFPDILIKNNHEKVFEKNIGYFKVPKIFWIEFCSLIHVLFLKHLTLQIKLLASTRSEVRFPTSLVLKDQI